MSNSLPALAALLQPLTAEAFLCQYWERQPLHLKGRTPCGYEQLVSLSQLEELVGSPQMRFPAIQLSKEGHYFPAAVFTDDIKVGADVFAGMVNLKRLSAEYRAGATVVLPGLHHMWEPLGQLCASLDAQLHHVSHANAYLTPGNTEGFAPHYDTHEVFVLQVAGTKRWRIFEPPVTLPHRRQPFNPVGYVLPDKPLLEANLKPGDLLYLPRGYVHTTTTSHSSSAHVTIGIDVYTWVDLAGEILQAALEDPPLRAALPPGFLSDGDTVNLAHRLSKQLGRIVDAIPPERLLEAFARRGIATRRASRGHFRSQVTVVTPESILEVPEAHTYRIVRAGPKVALEFGQQRLLLPGPALAVLEAMRTLRTFKGSQLPLGLDAHSQLALIRELVDKGFLQPAVSDPQL